MFGSLVPVHKNRREACKNVYPSSLRPCRGFGALDMPRLTLQHNCTACDALMREGNTKHCVQVMSVWMFYEFGVSQHSQLQHDSSC